MRNKGQTLLEVIIATGVVSVALVAIIGIVVQSLVASAESKQRTQATFLAQDVIERILTVRNWNYKLIKSGNPIDWDYNFYTQDGYYDYGSCCTGTPYEFSFLNTNLVDDTLSTFDLLNYDGISFTRYIEIKNNGSSEERVVNVKVTWPSSKGTGEVILSTIITKLP